MANKVEAGKSENLTKRGRGRPKGSKNKTTMTAKAIIEETADALGGAKRLTAWVKENERNERAFWSTIYPRLLPLQVNGPGENGEHTVVHKIAREIIAP